MQNPSTEEQAHGMRKDDQSFFFFLFFFFSFSFFLSLWLLCSRQQVQGVTSKGIDTRRASEFGYIVAQCSDIRIQKTNRDL